MRGYEKRPIRGFNRQSKIENQESAMGKRDIHYEAAFESYLQAKGWPYVLVDEARKTVFANVKIKSFDFLVYSDSQPNLLVDIKGRKFPDTSRASSVRSSRAWENWVTREDVDSLGEWQQVFGQDFRAVLVFAYWLQGPPQQAPFGDVHFFRGRHYAFVGVGLDDYAAVARRRSDKWQTLAMPSAQFARCVKDVAAFL